MTGPKSLRLAVIGAGHLGRIHTRLAKSQDEFEVVGIIDPLESARSCVSQEFDVPAFCSHTEIIDQIDAAIVATPTKFHHVVATELLEQGVHVFVEKPLTPTVEKAKQLVDLADENNVVLQVGHVERFNPALHAVLPSLGNPKYIEAVRTSGYTFRSTDIGAVLDLMIHDLDITLSLVNSEVTHVEAIGLSMFGGHEDMAQARIHFADGCVANLTASRCSYAAQRHMQVFTETGYANIDFAAHTAKFIRPQESLIRREIDFNKLTPDQKQFVRDNLFTEYFPIEDIPVQPTNAILEEQHDFIHAIQTGESPTVTGQAGLASIQVATKILNQIATHEWTDTTGTSKGPLYIPPPITLPLSSQPQQDEQPIRKAG